MSRTLVTVGHLVHQGKVRISAHGYDELAADHLYVKDILASIAEAVVIEDCPDYAKGPCVLVLQQDPNGEPVHVLWGIPRGQVEPAVLVTAYRPDVNRWTNDFLRRRS